MSTPTLVSSTPITQVDVGGGARVFGSTTFVVPPGLTDVAVLVWLDNHNANIDNLRLNDGSGALFTSLGAGIAAGTSYGVQGFIMVGLAAGTYALYDDSADSNGSADVEVWQNVNQVTPCSVLDSVFTQAITTAISASGEVAVCALAHHYSEFATPVDIGTAMVVIPGDSASNFGSLVTAYKPGASSVTFTWADAGDSVCMVVSLKPASDGVVLLVSRFGSGGFGGFSK